MKVVGAFLLKENPTKSVRILFSQLFCFLNYLLVLFQHEESEDCYFILRNFLKNFYFKESNFKDSGRGEWCC